jgi:hypothetical protein
VSDEFEGEDGGFEGFEDFLSNLKPGTKVAGNFLRYREGGDALDWSVPGQTKRIPLEWFMQIGIRSDTFGAATSGMLSVTFPQAYHRPPWIIAGVMNTLPAFTRAYVISTLASSAEAEFYWRTATNITYIEISWMVIGPTGMQ